MSTKSECPHTTTYQIEVASRIDPGRAAWLGNLSISVNLTEDGSTITVLTGPITDQAALYGILNRIRDMGLRLISVNEVQPQTAKNKLDQADGEQNENLVQ